MTFSDMSGLRRLMEIQLGVPVDRFVWVVECIHRLHLDIRVWNQGQEVQAEDVN